MMKQRSVLEFHILSGEASREVLSRGGDQRRVNGFATMDPRRRGSHFSRNIFSLLELGSSGQDRLRGKLWPLSFGIRMASCLWTFWARSAGRLWPVHPTPAETEEWHPGQATGHWHQGHHHSSRQLAYSYILRPRWETCETGMDSDSSPAVQHWFGIIRLPPVRTTERLPPGQYFTNNGELKTTVSLSSKNVHK